MNAPVGNHEPCCGDCAWYNTEIGTCVWDEHHIVPAWVKSPILQPDLPQHCCTFEPRLPKRTGWEREVAEFRNIWTTRERCIFNDYGIRTLADLCRLTEQDLLEIRNVGRVTRDHVVAELAKRGLRLREM